MRVFVGLAVSTTLLILVGVFSEPSEQPPCDPAYSSNCDVDRAP